MRQTPFFTFASRSSDVIYHTLSTRFAISCLLAVRENVTRLEGEIAGLPGRPYCRSKAAIFGFDDFESPDDAVFGRNFKRNCFLDMTVVNIKFRYYHH